jgi:hypothetical protein
MTDTRGKVCTRTGPTSLGSDLLLGQGGHEFAAEVGDHAAPDRVYRAVWMPGRGRCLDVPVSANCDNGRRGLPCGA